MHYLSSSSSSSSVVVVVVVVAVVVAAARQTPTALTKPQKAKQQTHTSFIHQMKRKEIKHIYDSLKQYLKGNAVLYRTLYQTRS